jgi:hypothetical protein
MQMQCNYGAKHLRCYSALLHTESHDLEHTVSKAIVGEAVAQVHQAIVESPNTEVTMIVVEKPTLEAARASTAQDMALVVVSAPLLISSPVGHASSS